MKRQALTDLRAAIEANTTRKSLDELRKQGKRHVRVVSGEKVMKIITAIVNDIVDREVGVTTKDHRTRIAEKTKHEFDRVLKMQTDQDGLIKQQQEAFDGLKEQLERSNAKVEGARQELEGSRAELLGKELEVKQLKARAGDEGTRTSELQEGLRSRDVEVGQLQARLAEESGRVKELHEQLGERDKQMDQLSAATVDGGARLNAVRDELRTVQGELDSVRDESRDAGMRAEQLTETLKARDERLSEVSGDLQERTLELERLRAERDVLNNEVASLRDRAADSGVVEHFQAELAEMKEAMLALNDRPAVADDAVVQAIVEQLTQRETSSSSDLEERFSAQLNRSLDEIQKTMKRATAAPIDVVVEATDVLIDKLFDHGEDELSTNLDQLDVEAHTSKASIGSNLDRLRAMRAGQALEAEQDETESDDPAESKEEFPPEGNHGPTPPEESVSDQSRKKMTASMDRLKAVREKADEDE